MADLQIELNKMLKYMPTIHLTQEALDRSIRKKRYWCIITRSLCYSIPEAVRVRADVHEIAFTLRGFRLTWTTPVRAAEIAYEFDKYGKKRIQPLIGTRRATIRMGRPKGVIPVIPQSRTSPTNVRSGRHVGSKSCNNKSSTRWNGLALPPRLLKLIQKRNRRKAWRESRRAA